MTTFTAADLLPGPDGRAYHLDIDPELITESILLCGDPGRVETVAGALLKSCTEPIRHRGLTTIVGSSTHGQRITVTTSGMGTPSLEIVARELSALRCVDLRTRSVRTAAPKPLRVIRLGTSGSLQREIPIGAAVITDWSIGLDNAGLYYDIPPPDGGVILERTVRAALEDATPHDHRFRGSIVPYVARSHPEIVRALIEGATTLQSPFAVGTTISAPGLFAAQGRPVEGLRNTIPDLDVVLGALDVPADQRPANFEMEAAMLNHLGAGWRWLTGAICVALANRRDESAQTTDYESAVLRAAEVALYAFGVLEGDSRIGSASGKFSSMA